MVQQARPASVKDFHALLEYLSQQLTKHWHQVTTLMSYAGLLFGVYKGRSFSQFSNESSH